MFTGLSHGAVGGSDDQNSTVHLSGAGDHVLDIVGVARAVDVSVMALVGLIFHMSGVDRNTTGSLFGGLINLIIRFINSLAGEGQILRDSSSQGGLAVVDMADGADVYVGLCALKLLLSHGGLSSLINI
ncbi:hypothetical protein SDC9_122298 [bioreactor metagenome]|uniref:Uncharacterized protein n=1 Tax=bioreactor metagenome TaxID=1076179 RepID=A0A645CEA9_9ZZZZ